MKLNLWKPLLAAALGLALFSFARPLAAQEGDDAAAQDNPAQAEDEPAKEGEDDAPKEEGAEGEPDQAALQKKLEDIRNQLQELINEGKLEEAKELQAEYAKVAQELLKARLGGGGPGVGSAVVPLQPPGGVFPGGGFPGGGIGGFGGQPLDKEEAEKRIAGLKAAADGLREAGIEDRAAQLEQEAKMIEQMLKAPPRPAVGFGGGIGGGPELAKTIEELQTQVKELAQAVKDLQEQVKELSGKSGDSEK